MLKKVDIVVFDFDGTLSANDSNIAFGLYCFKHSIRPWLFLPIIFICFLSKCFNPEGKWWREKMRAFLTNDMIKKFGADFLRQHRQERFGWSKDQVLKEKKAGNVVLLVSAGPNYLIPQLVKDIKFDAVLCSEMDDQRPNVYKYMCFGINKVYAMDKWARENKIIPHVVRSYSDSHSDMPMMKIADEMVWIDRKTGLRKEKV